MGRHTEKHRLQLKKDKEEAKLKRIQQKEQDKLDRVRLMIKFKKIIRTGKNISQHVYEVGNNKRCQYITPDNNYEL